MIKFNIQLFGGRGASSNLNSRMSFSLKKDVKIKNTIIKKGTKFTNVVELAGGKRRRKVDKANYLSKKYGGNPENWSKRRATVVIGNKKREVHYFQHPRVGKVEYKFVGR